MGACLCGATSGFMKRSGFCRVTEYQEIDRVFESVLLLCAACVAVPGIAITNFYAKNKFDGNKDLISSNAEDPTVFATGYIDVFQAYCLSYQ
jgi:hypothetical protein